MGTDAIKICRIDLAIGYGMTILFGMAMVIIMIMMLKMDFPVRTTFPMTWRAELSISRSNVDSNAI